LTVSVCLWREEKEEEEEEEEEGLLRRKSGRGGRGALEGRPALSGCASTLARACDMRRNEDGESERERVRWEGAEGSYPRHPSRP